MELSRSSFSKVGRFGTVPLMLLLLTFLLASPMAGSLPTSSIAYSTGPMLGQHSQLAPMAPQNSCPNVNFYGSSTQMNLSLTVDCAGAAGFTGNLEITFVSMAYQESTFCPGAIESGSGGCMDTSPGCGSGYPDAEGILQEGVANQCPPVGTPFSVTGYSPSSCSTWSGSSSDWSGIYFNPLCSFQWALAYYNYNSYNFWGSYLSGAYCKWAPTGFAGTGSMLCDSANGYPSGGENLNNLPWSTVCPGNVCGNSSSTPLASYYNMNDTTTSTALTCGATFAGGNQIQFTGVASGGTSPYTYAWNFGDGTTGTGATVTHVYTAAGTVNPTLTVTDSTGATNTTGKGCSFTVTAPPTPTISSFSASPATVAVGSATNFTVQVTGGTTPYSYAYTGLPGGCATANLSKLACTPTASGNFTVTVTVTDALAKTISGTTTLVVTIASTPLLITQFWVGPSTIPLGGTAYINVTATGGTTPYTYQFTGLPTGCTSSSTASLSCTPTVAGVFSSIVATVTDASGATTTSSAVTLTVQGTGPVVSAFTATPSTVVLGNSSVLAATVSGGTTPYSYSYTGLPAGCSSSNASSIPCTPTAAGTFSIKVTVTDAAGRVANGSTSLTVSPATSGSLTISSFTIAPSTVAVNGTAYLNVSATGGTAPLTYAYTGLPLGCASADQASLTCVPTAAGNFTITVKVTDAGSHTATKTATLQVTSPSGYPTVTSFVATPASVSVGSTTYLSAVVTGGQSPYSYSYSGLPTGCTSANASTLNCTPTATGTFSVQLKVTDALGHLVYASTSVSVTSSAPTLAIVGYSASQNPDYVGEATYLNVTTSGGQGPFTYSFTGLPQGCTSADVASLKCVPGAAGNFTVTVAVSDSSGQQVFGTYTLVVKNAIVPPPNNTASTNPTAVTDWALIAGVVVVGAVAVAVIVRKHRRDRALQE